MEARAPRLVEGPRHCLVLRGSKTSALTLSLLRSLHIVQQPYSVALQRHHSLHPFDDATSLEFLLSKADASTFVLGSHSKKRPNNLVLGRTFDYQLLDMVEYGVVDASYEGVEAFEGVRKAIVRLGSKPALVFQGELWDSGDDWAVQRSLWLDLLKADDLSRINLSALDRVFVLSALPPDRVELRHFAIRMRPSTSKVTHGHTTWHCPSAVAPTDSSPSALSLLCLCCPPQLPYVELDEMGPRVSLTFRRRLQASADLVKASLVQPKSAGRKNVSRSDAGDRVGRVHMARQDLSNVAIAKLKGLKRKRGHGMGEEDDAGGGQGAGGGTDGADGAGAAAKKRRGVSGAGGYGPNRAPAPAVQAKTPARSGSNR